MKSAIRSFLCIFALMVCCGQDLMADEPSLFEQYLPTDERVDFANAGSVSLSDDPQTLPEIDWVQAVRGQSGDGGGGGDLASKSQNPVSDLASIPLQNNFNIGVEPMGRTSYIGNLQPVVPLKINEEWNLIARAIMPIVNTPVGGDVRMDGLGDSVAQFFISPSEPSEFVWGVGPSFMLPTASDQTLGVQEWGAGINAVGLVLKNQIVTGVLVNQMYSFEGTTKPMLIQPFFNYNLPEGWFLSLSGEANADWEQTQDRRWSVVGGPGIGRVFPFMGQPMNLLVRCAPYMVKPIGGPDWQVRFQATMLFPK